MIELDSETLAKLLAASIPTHPDPPRTAESLAEELGVPVGRIRDSIARIKDEFPELPLTSGYQGYRWSRDQVDIKRHARKEVRYISTRTRRSLLDAVLEPYHKHCSPEAAERARQRIEFILDDLARMQDPREKAS